MFSDHSVWVLEWSRTQSVVPVSSACRYILFSLHSNDEIMYSEINYIAVVMLKTGDFTGKLEFLASEI